MNIIQAASSFLPHSYGGTEVYVAELAQSLKRQGVHSLIVAPQEGTQPAQYTYDQLDVYRYPVPPAPSDAELREMLPHAQFAEFANWLKQQSASVYHQHSYRFDCGFHHLKQAKRLGMATIVTLHLPEPLCIRQTMMFKGIEPCNGKVDEHHCGTCLGMSEKVPAWVARSLGQLPLGWGKAAKARLHQQESRRWRQLGTTLSTPALVAAQRDRLQQMAALSDRIVAVSHWMYEALAINGIPPEKLVLCPEASPVAPQPQLKRPRLKDAPLRIGMLGRWHPIKGIDILAEAVHRLPPDLPVELTIHASLHGKHHTGNQIQQQVLELAAIDPRIQVKPVLARTEVSEAVAAFDLLAVPSQCQETGPLVVLEAFAVKTPVLGSNLGGIAELVRHNVDGWLVSFNDVNAWTTHPAVIERWQHGIEPVRTMETIATSMKAVYEQLKLHSEPSAQWMTNALASVL
jgi:glycosyltransferase involved in cell wall biosynthesis